ncbi:MAG TPA: hypothetical protein DCM38_06380 [Gammaproteobacteria bacterium]|nr:hypothetical protein [Gammaproteobacteria bacterium]
MTGCKKRKRCKFLNHISVQLSIISYQLSVISYQLSVISYQLLLLIKGFHSQFTIILMANMNHNGALSTMAAMFP